MSVNKILTENKLMAFFHEPSGTTAENVAWKTQKDKDGFAVGYLRCVGTDALTALSIVVGNAVSPTTVAVVKSKTVTTNPDAVDDYVFIEASNEEILAAATAAGISGVELFVSAQVTEAAATNDSAIIYIQPGLVQKDGLTVDAIA